MVGSRPLCQCFVELGRPGLSKMLIWYVTSCSATALAPHGPTVLSRLPCGGLPACLAGSILPQQAPTLRILHSLHFPMAHICHVKPLQMLFPLPGSPFLSPSLFLTPVFSHVASLSSQWGCWA